MTDQTIIDWIIGVGFVYGHLAVPLGILGAYMLVKLVDRWIAYRLRVRRNQRRADYIRWWQSH